MKLKLAHAPVNAHGEIVTAVTWGPGNELYSCSDDKQILKHDIHGEVLGKVCDVDAYVTDIAWLQTSDTFAIACTDGSFRLMNRNGREEKRVDNCSEGAVICLKWNFDGSTLATGGEDGTVKIWSRAGLYRNQLAQTSRPVHSIAWGPDNNLLLFSSGSQIIIKAHQGAVEKKQTQWTAVDNNGVVMCADWCAQTGLVVSCGEDRCYKVWDAFGRALFKSEPLDNVVTTVSWCPSGEYFAVGAFDVMRLCDKMGWSHSRHRPSSGSLMSISWTNDGTQVAAGGGNGAVVFGHVIERRIESLSFEATQTDSLSIVVSDVANENSDQLDFRDRIVNWSLGYGYLVAATASQCTIYTTGNFNTAAAQIDLNSATNLILQCSRQFLIVSSAGLSVFTYEGRQVCSPRAKDIRYQFLHAAAVSMSDEVLAVLDNSNYKSIHVFDIARGGQPATQKPITHNLEIVQVAVSKHPKEPVIAFIDKNRDLYLVHARANARPAKLHTMVDTMAWNDEADVLVALADSKLITWYHPATVFIDSDLLPETRTEQDGTRFGKLSTIASFLGTQIKIRRADGALLTTMALPYPIYLHRFVNQLKWDEAVRLCRFVKNDALWATLAVMAIHGLHLDTAINALAATKHVDKLHYIMYVKDIPTSEGRNAALAIYQRRYEEAESILLQASPPFVYRAIKMNIRLFRWSRALEIAVNHKKHVDTVLYYRRRYLSSHKREETDERFKQYFDSVDIADEEALAAKREAERETERSRESKY